MVNLGDDGKPKPHKTRLNLWKIVFRINYLEKRFSISTLLISFVNKYGRDSSGYYIATDVFLRKSFENAAETHSLKGGMNC
jgi:hypothetical protein